MKKKSVKRIWKKDKSKQQIKYYKGGLSHEEVRDYLSKRMIEAFDKWIYGQTCPVILVNGKEAFGYYESDVERFADGVILHKITYFD